jgi:hypothetical protein
MILSRFNLGSIIICLLRNEGWSLQCNVKGEIEERKDNDFGCVVELKEAPICVNETMVENDSVPEKKPRIRPIVRLGFFLISHSNYVRYTLRYIHTFFIWIWIWIWRINEWVRITVLVGFFSLLCFVSGIVALLLLPILANNTYTSENALMPG